MSNALKTSNYTYPYFIQALEQAKQSAKELTESVDENQFLLRPSPKKWSMGEILSHLVQAGNEYLPQIRRGIPASSDKVGQAKESFTPNAFFRYFIKSVSPESTRPLPTVPSFKPDDLTEINKAKILDEFLTLQDELLELIKICERESYDLDQLKTRNPIIRILPMSLTACYGIIDAHQRRHFGQMQAIKDKF